MCVCMCVNQTKSQNHSYLGNIRTRVINHAHGLFPACHLFLLIKFCWKTATPVHLHIVYGYFYTTTWELSSCNRDWHTKLKIFTIHPFTVFSLTTPGTRAFPWKLGKDKGIYQESLISEVSLDAIRQKY